MGCAARVRGLLSTIDAVQSVEVDMQAKTATVTTKPGTSVTREQCARALEGSKYSLTGFEVL